jgi:hypothetical protein
VIEQKYPELGIQAVDANDEVLKTPRENSEPSTIEIISMAQPYVIRYSMALCALKALRPFILSPVTIVWKRLKSFIREQGRRDCVGAMKKRKRR